MVNLVAASDIQELPVRNHPSAPYPIRVNFNPLNKAMRMCSMPMHSLLIGHPILKLAYVMAILPDKLCKLLIINALAVDAYIMVASGNENSDAKQFLKMLWQNLPCNPIKMGFKHLPIPAKIWPFKQPF